VCHHQKACRHLRLVSVRQAEARLYTRSTQTERVMRKPRVSLFSIRKQRLYTRFGTDGYTASSADGGGSAHLGNVGKLSNSTSYSPRRQSLSHSTGQFIYHVRHCQRPCVTAAPRLKDVICSTHCTKCQSVNLKKTDYLGATNVDDGSIKTDFKTVHEDTEWFKLAQDRVQHRIS
jgi:hypothetical protein